MAVLNPSKILVAEPLLFGLDTVQCPVRLWEYRWATKTNEYGIHVRTLEQAEYHACKLGRATCQTHVHECGCGLRYTTQELKVRDKEGRIMFLSKDIGEEIDCPYCGDQFGVPVECKVCHSQICPTCGRVVVKDGQRVEEE